MAHCSRQGAVGDEAPEGEDNIDFTVVGATPAEGLDFTPLRHTDPVPDFTPIRHSPKRAQHPRTQDFSPLRRNTDIRDFSPVRHIDPSDSSVTSPLRVDTSMASPPRLETSLVSPQRVDTSLATRSSETPELVRRTSSPRKIEADPADTEKSRALVDLNLECPVCLQICIHPVRLPCTHVFCFLCIKGVANHSKKCALCRHDIPVDYLNNPVLLDTDQLATDVTRHHQGYQWYYEGRNGWWQYDERASRELEEKFSSGAKIFELLIAGFLYIIDLENMYQLRRNDPSRRRRMKRDLVTIEKKGVAGLKVAAPSVREGAYGAEGEKTAAPVSGGGVMAPVSGAVVLAHVPVVPLTVSSAQKTNDLNESEDSSVVDDLDTLDISTRSTDGAESNEDV